MECTAQINITRKYPAVVNHDIQTAHVRRLALKWLGEAHFSEDDLPIAASEDFSYYL